MKTYNVVWKPMGCSFTKETEIQASDIDAAVERAGEVIPSEARLIEVYEV